MKIKKYTIDQEIPKGSVFMFKECYQHNRYAPENQYYFLVEEEIEASQLTLKHVLDDHISLC